MYTILNFFKRKKYLDQLYKAFPDHLREDVKAVFDIFEIDNKFLSSNMGKYTVTDLISNNCTEHIVSGKKIIIPDRVYFNEPSSSKVQTLSITQRQILNCILLTNANGYIRQKYLKDLEIEFGNWVIPYVIMNLGGYVLEILNELDLKIDNNNIKLFSEYVSENNSYWVKTKSRVISYWNEYYRESTPNVKDYVGYKIIQRIES